MQIEDGLNTAVFRGEPPGEYRIVVRPPDDASQPGRLTIQIRDALTPAAIAQRQAELAAWIRATGFSLRTITPTDDDFSDLEPLVAKIGSSRVVMLGEQTHNDGATFLAKARLLRFLHQRLGFDVLAWEGGFLDVARLEQELRRAVPFDSLPRRLYRNWWESAQVRPVFDYARNTHATTRPLVMAGIDPQMGQDTAYARSLLDFLAQPDTGFITRSDEDAIRAEMTSVMDVLIAVRSRPGARDSLRDVPRPAPALLLRLIDHVKTRREHFESIHGREAVAFHLQALENVLALEREIRVMVDSGGFASPKANNTRDQMMAHNLAWLATERYPGRKIVVWAASFHILRQPAFVDAGFDGVTTLGAAVAELLPLESFAIAFVTYSGRLGSPATGEQWDVPPAPVSTFEALLHDMGHRYVFVDLRDTPSRPLWIRDGFVARPGGNLPQWSQWARQFDAFVFIDKMTPSTRAAGR